MELGAGMSAESGVEGKEAELTVDGLEVEAKLALEASQGEMEAAKETEEAEWEKASLEAEQ